MSSRDDGYQVNTGCKAGQGDVQRDFTDVRRQGSGGKSVWRYTAALEIKMKKACGSLRVVRGVPGSSLVLMQVVCRWDAARCSTDKAKRGISKGRSRWRHASIGYWRFEG